MQSIDLIRRNLEQSRDLVLARVEEMRDHCVVFPTPNGGGNTIWVLGHLAYIEGQVIREFGLGQENPRAGWAEIFDGSEMSGELRDYPPFDEVLAACREARGATLATLDSLSEAGLDTISANIPKGFDDTFGTLRHCVQFAADHWYMHRGQLADSRRAAGLERMWL